MSYNDGYCSYCGCTDYQRVYGVIHTHGAVHDCHCIACDCGLVINPVEIIAPCACETGAPCNLDHTRIRVTANRPQFA